LSHERPEAFVKLLRIAKSAPNVPGAKHRAASAEAV